MRLERWSAARRRIGFGFAVLVGTMVGTTSAPGQPPARPQFKGIWEPVSFTEDLDLKDIFFVTAEVGWAAGEGGTVIHTKDGGATWTSQLGGDPASTEPPIDHLRFIDEYRGWAVQGKKLLHTANGQEWEEVPGTLPSGMRDYAFVSRSQGVASGTSTTQGWPTEVFLTRDGGKTWKSVANCSLRVMIDGVNRNVNCIIRKFHFPTPKVGYLIAYQECVGVGCGGPPVLGKTEDGGATWRFLLGPGDVKLAELKDLFFTDQNTGFLHVRVFPGDPKVFSTADGGATWKGLIGSPGTSLRFADPEVGWGFDEDKLNFTTDGGARWNSRAHRFPTHPRAFSFPRRDRAYVAGDHGMVFRYRVVPVERATPPEVLVTAPMPAFASPLGEQVAQLDRLVDSLQAFVQILPAQPAKAGAAAAASSDPNAAPPATPSDSAVASGASADQTPDPNLLPPLDAPLPPASGFAADCCAKRFSRLEVIIGAIAGSLPQLITKNKNTNLLLAAVRMLADLPGQFRSVKGGLAAFRTATDQGAAVAALVQVTSAIETLKAQTSAALQKDLPPLDLGGSTPPVEPAPNQAEAPASAPVAAAEQSVAVAADTAAEKGKSTVAEAAKKGLGGLIKKRVKIP